MDVIIIIITFRVYYRISNDLLLWESSAPVQNNFFSDSNSKFQPGSEDDNNFAQTFSLCKSAAQCG